MTDQQPAPADNGYQPGAEEGITEVTVIAKPNRDYQSASVALTYAFPTPRQYHDVVGALDHLQRAAAEEAEDALAKVLGQSAGDSDGGSQASKPQTSDSGNGDGGGQSSFLSGSGTSDDGGEDDDGWRVGNRRGGKGTIDYLSTDAYKSSDLIDNAKQAVDDQGIDPDQVVVFDERVGNDGMQEGGTAYSAFTVKARKGTALAEAMGNRSVVSFGQFDSDGSLDVSFTDDVKALLN